MGTGATNAIRRSSKQAPQAQQPPSQSHSPAIDSNPGGNSSPGCANQTDEATIVIRSELDSNRSLSIDRRQVLESALSLIRHFNDSAQPDQSPLYAQGTPEEIQGADDEIPVELFYMMWNRMSFP